MSKMKRDVWELNHFQLNILKPFYIAVLGVAVFFAAMVYAFLFFPEKYNLKTIILTECEPGISFPMIAVSLMSLIFSVSAFWIVGRNGKAPALDSQGGPQGLGALIPSLTAGLAMLFALVVLVYAVFQNYLAPHMRPGAGFMRYEIEPHQVMVVAAGLAVLVLIVWLFYWAYRISNRVLGPFERILADLDRVVDGTSLEALYVRPGDEMFEELVKRINVLIKRQKERTHDRQKDGI